MISDLLQPPPISPKMRRGAKNEDTVLQEDGQGLLYKHGNGRHCKRGGFEFDEEVKALEKERLLEKNERKEIEWVEKNIETTNILQFV